MTINTDHKRMENPTDDYIRMANPKISENWHTQWENKAHVYRNTMRMDN